MENMTEKKTLRFPGIKDGDTFEVAGYEFIKFPDRNGMTPIVMRDTPFRSCFGSNNNLKGSDVLKRMEAEILPAIIDAIGAENVCTFETDLMALDGLKPYGKMESQISLPTLAFYREHVEIFDKYPVANAWWLATPESAHPHYSPTFVLCVAPSGFVFSNYYYYVFGVRPFLIFVSSIFESYEE